MARKVNDEQEDSCHLSRGNFIVNTSFHVFDLVSSPTSPTFVCKFSFDAEVLDIGNQDCILGLSWLMENGFLVDTQERCSRNAMLRLR